MVSPELPSRLIEADKANDTTAVALAISSLQVKEPTRLLVGQVGMITSVKGLGLV